MPCVSQLSDPWLRQFDRMQHNVGFVEIRPVEGSDEGNCFRLNAVVTVSQNPLKGR